MSERSRRLVTTVWVALTCVIGVGPTVLLAVAWPSVPETVPAHWGVSLEPDRWGSRLELWVIPVICLAGMLVAATALGVLAARSGRAARDVLARDRDAAVLWFVPHAILAPAATVSAAQLGVALGWLGSWAMAVLPVIVAIVEIALLCVLGDFPARLRKGEW